jgi:hypothetical protein
LVSLNRSGRIFSTQPYKFSSINFKSLCSKCCSWLLVMKFTLNCIYVLKYFCSLFVSMWKGRHAKPRSSLNFFWCGHIWSMCFHSVPNNVPCRKISSCSLWLLSAQSHVNKMQADALSIISIAMERTSRLFLHP